MTSLATVTVGVGGKGAVVDLVKGAVRPIRTIVLVALATTLAAVAVGCGSPSTSSGASSGGSKDAAQELTAYLASARTTRTQYIAAQGRLEQTVQSLNAAPVSSWSGLATQIDTLNAQLHSTRVAWLQVQPPAALAAAHGAYAQSMDLWVQYYGMLANGLRSGADMRSGSALGNQLDALSSSADQEFEKYRFAVTARAQELGVTVPWTWQL